DMVRGSGVDSAAVDRWQKEAGLKRMGFSMQDVALGGAKVSNSYRTVTDDSGSITWKSLSLQSGGLKVNYDARKVDLGFSRFPDLAESDRDQLMKEAGMARQNF